MTLRQKRSPPDRQGVVCPMGQKSVHHLPLSCPAAAEASLTNIIIPQLYLLPCPGFPEMLTAERRPECEGEGSSVSTRTVLSPSATSSKDQRQCSHDGLRCTSALERSELWSFLLLLSSGRAENRDVLVDQQRKDWICWECYETKKSTQKVLFMFLTVTKRFWFR